MKLMHFGTALQEKNQKDQSNTKDLYPDSVNQFPCHQDFAPFLSVSTSTFLSLGVVSETPSETEKSLSAA